MWPHCIGARHHMARHQRVLQMKLFFWLNYFSAQHQRKDGWNSDLTLPGNFLFRRFVRFVRTFIKTSFQQFPHIPPYQKIIKADNIIWKSVEIRQFILNLTSELENINIREFKKVIRRTWNPYLEAQLCKEEEQLPPASFLIQKSPVSFFIRRVALKTQKYVFLWHCQVVFTVFMYSDSLQLGSSLAQSSKPRTSYLS